MKITKNWDTGIITIALVYVDDVLFFGNSKEQIYKYIEFLATRFTTLTKVDVVNRNIGVDITRNIDDDTIILNQKIYHNEYVKENVNIGTCSEDTPLTSTVDYESRGTQPPTQG